MKNYHALIDFKALGKILLTADTPGHLLEKFKKNDSVQYLHDLFRDEELIQAFYEEMSTSYSIRREILLNALATAVWFKDTMHATRFFKDLIDKNYSKSLDSLAVSYFSQTKEIL